ncbi:unnamed protein product [Darwinula stevensoni]|uniref:Nucleolar and spindle-associated protein 1 n=1 Tax=Darwinula stevensoni TaxID=69355 RepID=A0A7R9A1H4_9CRUS|nr:unnamed protein product [Darwinula stevensoni]CAG0883510.1 unnamed protein product [Darwinula stevensoni]
MILSREELEKLKYGELQKKAKALGIKANKKAEQLIEEIISAISQGHSQLKSDEDGYASQASLTSEVDSTVGEDSKADCKDQPASGIDEVSPSLIHAVGDSQARPLRDWDQYASARNETYVPFTSTRQNQPSASEASVVSLPHPDSLVEGDEAITNILPEDRPQSQVENSDQISSSLPSPDESMPGSLISEDEGEEQPRTKKRKGKTKGGSEKRCGIEPDYFCLCLVNGESRICSSSISEDDDAKEQPKEKKVKGKTKGGSKKRPGSSLITEDESTDEQSIEKSGRKSSSRGRSKKRKLQSGEPEISESALQGITGSPPEVALALPSSDQPTQGSGTRKRSRPLSSKKAVTSSKNRDSTVEKQMEADKNRKKPGSVQKGKLSTQKGLHPHLGKSGIPRLNSKPRVSKVKAPPNFKLIHQKAQEKMESIDVYMKRKQEKHQSLTKFTPKVMVRNLGASQGPIKFNMELKGSAFKFGDGKNPFTPSKLARSGESKKSVRPTNLNVTTVLGNDASMNLETSVASINQTFTCVPAKKLTKKMEMALKLPGNRVGASKMRVREQISIARHMARLKARKNVVPSTPDGKQWRF